MFLRDCYTKGSRDFSDLKVNGQKPYVHNGPYINPLLHTKRRLIAQTYDGPNIMYDSLGGVQAKMEVYLFAHFVCCMSNLSRILAFFFHVHLYKWMFWNK